MSVRITGSVVRARIFQGGLTVVDASGQSALPAGGTVGQVLTVVQESPRVLAWGEVAIDGGTFF